MKIHWQSRDDARWAVEVDDDAMQIDPGSPCPHCDTHIVWVNNETRAFGHGAEEHPLPEKLISVYDDGRVFVRGPSGCVEIPSVRETP